MLQCIVCLTSKSGSIEEKHTVPVSAWWPALHRPTECMCLVNEPCRLPGLTWMTTSRALEIATTLPESALCSQWSMIIYQNVSLYLAPTVHPQVWHP